MKIMFCTSSMGKGGTERVISVLSNYFIQDNQIVIVLNTTKNIDYALDKRIKLIQLDKKQENINNSIARNITRIKTMKRVIESEKPDVILTFLPLPSFRAIIANRKYKIPIIVADRANPAYEYKDKISKILVKLLYNKADAFVFQTSEQKEYFNKKIQDKSIIIFNPIADEFTKDLDREVYKEKTIISVGRLAEKKNQKMLIDAFSKFLKTNPDYKLKIFGQGPLKEQLQNQINELDMDKNIFLCGVSNNIREELEKSEIFVLSSDSEGMPNVLIEAMAVGLPVISTDCPCGGPRELIDDGKNGILIPVKDEDKLIENLEQLIQKPYWAKELGKNAKNVRQLLKTESIVKKWKEYIDYVVKKKKQKRKTRLRRYLKICYVKVVSLIPDKIFLKILYWRNSKRKLNLKNPQTFNEKLQWLKLYDRNSEYTKMVDKYEVKEYVSKLIGAEYIIPTIGIYDRFEDINFNELPNEFVIKCTHDSESTIICKDKNNMNVKEIKNKIKYLLKINFFYMGREWPYKNVKPRIIIEKYMASKEQPELIDYKFFCFNGEPKFIYVSEGLSNHATATISFADMDYELMDFYRKDYKPFEKLPPKPKNFEKMKKLAKILSNKIPFVRVDFYEIEGRVYFGELTFFPCSGYIPFEPQKYDRILGDMLTLPKEKKEG